MTTPQAVPHGACDCHFHIYEDGRPLAPTATFKPPHAPVPAYREVQRALGLTRAVVVQPTGYGFDNSCTLDAIAALGPASRGIAVIEPGTSDQRIEELHEAGIRGVRYFMLPGGVLHWDSLEAMSARIADRNWNINLQLDGRELPRHKDMLLRLASPLVIDHTGKFLEPVTPESEAFGALLQLLDSGRCWVKLSAPYETSRHGPPKYEDVGRLARVLAQRYPQRCLWATNWPHPNQNPVPSSQAMLDLLFDWAPDAATRQAILVDNPARLYGF
ncbi:MAG TPA: amidohydrolase family protein [Ramlibacter sp.]|nr:amidohydrolase family protein [Ramlibacter sp.]